jgi:hypothetical protein
MAGSASELTPLATDDSRRLARTHLFVGATLSFAGGSSPVYIRNMSPSGALVEGAALPDQYAPATLRRGSLEAIVRVIWTASGKAGVSFLSAVHVADWMSRTLPSHQTKVDDLMRDIRTGQSGVSPCDQAVGGPSMDIELHALRRDLADLENALVRDAAVIAEHPEIQLLDIALQRIDGMIARFRGA